MTIDWTGKNKLYLRQALIVVFNSSRQLSKFFNDELEELEKRYQSLNQITSPDLPLDDQAYDLIEASQSGGWIDNLYRRLCEKTSTHPRIIQLQEELQDSSALAISGALQNPNLADRSIEDHEGGSSDVVVREASAAELVEPMNSAYLVLAAFWEGEKSLKKLQVVPKLCYRKQENPSEIYQEPLATQEGLDKYTVAIDKFPDFLKGLHTFALGKLRSYFDCPWKLSIKLFLPVDLLCLPLTTWCGKDGELVSRHAIVMGCSDRFNPDCPEEAIKLRNQLELQWERFLSKVPDQVGSTLRQLDWLNSEDVGRRGWIDHAGFRCFGDWLTPGDWEKLDEAAQKKWQDLINYGLPLALWMCEGQPTRAQRRRIFNRLIRGTRFDLLDYIPIERDIQRNSGECVGVLYEDLHYMPEPPPVPEQQFFGWPGF